MCSPSPAGSVGYARRLEQFLGDILGQIQAHTMLLWQRTDVCQPAGWSGHLLVHLLAFNACRDLEGMALG